MTRIGFIVCLALMTLCLRVQAQNSEQDKLAYDSRLTAYTYPFEVKTHRFQTQRKQLEMAYMWLQPKAGFPIVVLLHGKNFNGAYWQQTAQFLQQQGYGVLIPDQIGFGKSSKPTDYQYSFAALASNTNGLLKELGISKAIIVGHSMGGMLATRFALNYPQVTRKLILVNPIGLENYLQYVQYKDVDFFYQNELKLTAEKIKAYQQQNYYDGKWTTSYDALIQPLIGWVQGPDRDTLAYVSALTYDMLFTQPVVEEFSMLTVPTALILGTRDRTGPGRNWMKSGIQYELGRYDQLGETIQRRNHAIKLYPLDGLGHLPQIENFARFSQALKSALQ